MKNGLDARVPDVSVVVIIHNMAREAPRTLFSLSAAYQRHISADEYEVIVVDNGSTPPLDAEIIDSLSGTFRLIRLDPAPPSPARAINVGLAAARGAVIGVMIDGARIATPGLLHFARIGARIYPQSVVTTLGWYLGYDIQKWAIQAGYTKAQEDAMLASIDWPSDGYRLFEIAALDEPSIDGWFAPTRESNALFLRREAWDALGGVEERFDEPGGGLLNVDTFRRAISLPCSELVMLLGEATFHQLHGGIATNAKIEEFPAALAKWSKQYRSIRGNLRLPPSVKKPTYIGVLPRSALVHFVRAAVEPAAFSPEGPPLGLSFDSTLWSLTPARKSADPIVGALVDLAESEFRNRNFEAAASVARLARARDPAEPGPLQLLAHAGAWLADTKFPDFRSRWKMVALVVAHFVRSHTKGEFEYRNLSAQIRAWFTDGKYARNRRAEFHNIRATAFILLGDKASAKAEYLAALAFNPDHKDARMGLTELSTGE